MLNASKLPQLSKKKSEEIWSELEAKKLFHETIMDKIFETSSSFHVKYTTHYGKILNCIFQQAFASVNKRREEGKKAVD